MIKVTVKGSHNNRPELISLSHRDPPRWNAKKNKYVTIPVAGKSTK